MYRHKWIRIYGQEYHHSCMVQIGWQEDDLPIFAKVTKICVVVGTALCEVEKYFTEGINSHLSSYLIVPTSEKRLITISTLHNKDVFYAHIFLGDKKLYVSVQSHIERSCMD